jgi:excisionase family DNA binding protein
MSPDGAGNEQRTWSYDMETMNTRWITVDQMKNRLAISKTKAYQIANDGSLDTVRIGKSVRISEESLERWLKCMRSTKPQEGDEMD